MATKTIRPPKAPRRIHRSFTIDSELVAEAKRLAPLELANNLNRMIAVALMELVDKFKRVRFEREMAEMAGDGTVRRESARISREFLTAESDGL